MALVNQAKHEINAKIVFYGPGMAGKATNLKHIYNKLKPGFRGALKAMNVQEARMLFFDFTPPGDGNVDGFRVRFHVYTVSGDTVDPAAWRMVLKGADGIVFLADAAPQRVEENRDSLAKLEQFLGGYGLSLGSVPTVFEYNKADLADALGSAELDRQLNRGGFPSFRTSSTGGEGVLQALLALVKNVLTGLRSLGVEGIASGEALQHMVQPPHVVAPPVEPEPVRGAQRPEEVSAAADSSFEAAQFETAPFLAAEVETRRAEGEQHPAGISEAAEGPLSLELSGIPEPDGAGRIRVPLTIRCGSRRKSVLLSLALTLEEE